jgi:hypothetical protein
VSAKVRAKIWNGEYVDCGTLLGNPMLDEKLQISVRTGTAGGSPSLCLEPSSRSKKIQRLDNWIAAFHIFVGVYTVKCPTDAPALVKYGDIVRDLAARCHSWQFYDDNFPFLRQTHGGALPWGDIHGELWLRSQISPQQSSLTYQNPIAKPGNATFRKEPSPRIPIGYCFKYHRGFDVLAVHITTLVQWCSPGYQLHFSWFKPNV